MATFARIVTLDVGEGSEYSPTTLTLANPGDAAPTVSRHATFEAAMVELIADLRAEFARVAGGVSWRPT